jgi:hypothetical protein
MNRRVLLAAVLGAVMLVPLACGPAPDQAPSTTPPSPGSVALKGPPGMPDPTRARVMLDRLTRSNDVVEPSYDPALFGPGWEDPDGNGCTARADALQYWMGIPRLPGECDVDGAMYDPYTGQSVMVPSGAVVDHVVGVVDAWRGGADEWTAAQRARFYSDAENLVPTSKDAWRDKGNRGPDEWLPPRREFWCNFASVYVGVKAAYRLTITDAQAAAVEEALATCVVLPSLTLGRTTPR